MARQRNYCRTLSNVQRLRCEALQILAPEFLRVIVGAAERPCNVVAIETWFRQSAFAGVKLRKFIEDDRPGPAVDQQMVRAPHHLPFVVLGADQDKTQQLTGGKIEIS